MTSPVDNICRTCLIYLAGQSFAELESGEITMVSIFCVPDKTEEESLSLREMIKSTLPQLKLKENDQLPKNVCNKCSEKIEQIYNFQLKCIRNEEKFRKLLEVGDISDLFNNTKNEPEIIVKDETVQNLFNQNQSIELITDEILIENTLNFEDRNSSCDRLICDENNDSIWEERKLNTVEKQKVKKRSNKNKKVKQMSSKSRQLNAKELYSCGKCQRKLKSKLSLMKHHELHMKKDNEEKELKCNVCNQAFQEMSIFKEHQRTHSAEKPFLCSECGKGFTSAGSLKQHSFRHLDKKLYPCSECPKSFPTNGDLLCHYEIHKAKPRIHVCDVCGRGFYKPFLLKQHQRYHNNERPFACEFCEKRFVTLEKQRRHMRTHTGEKPYRCKYCERAFAQSNDCIKHLRQHLGDNVYQCELCPLRFPLARDLRVHFASHKDDDDETRSRNMMARIEEENKFQINIS